MKDKVIWFGLGVVATLAFFQVKNHLDKKGKKAGTLSPTIEKPLEGELQTK